MNNPAGIIDDMLLIRVIHQRGNDARYLETYSIDLAIIDSGLLIVGLDYLFHDI